MTLAAGHSRAAPGRSAEAPCRAGRRSDAATRRLFDNATNARRRVARDLHDGVQQRLVNLVIALRLAQDHVETDAERAHALLEDASYHAMAAIEELREVVAGIHPAILATKGLLPALKSLAARSALPTTVAGNLDGRLPETIEANAYFFAAEAITNALKHADATRVTVSARTVDATLSVEITDDGIGGAQCTAGGGLAGLTDRIHALHGRVTLSSPRGAGTTLRAEIPLPDAEATPLRRSA
jgi:signal transduction histidine kinase